MIIATSQEIAQKAAKLVKITYKDAKKPMLDIKEALKKQNPEKNELKFGNVDGEPLNQSGFFFFNF